MAETIPGRKVYKFAWSHEPEARELERTASVARYIYNWGLARCQAYYQQHGKGKPLGNLKLSEEYITHRSLLHLPQARIGEWAFA